MKLFKNTLLQLLFVLLGFYSSAQNLNINGSCVVNTGSLVNGGDASNTTYNGKPVYYSSALSLNYQSSATTAVTYLFYALASELGTAENRWVVSYDGQPYYYFISNASTPPTGEYLPFDTIATAANCGGSVFITEPCNHLDWANLQWPPSSTICLGENITAYGQAYEPGVTTIEGSPGANIDVEFGFNSANTNPSSWPSGNWSPAAFNALGGGPNNDEYYYTFTPVSGGTYYYTFRYRLAGCSWQYGGYSVAGGGFWDGNNYVNGSVTVNTLPILTCPANITVSNASGQCGANVSFAATATGTPTPSLSYSPASGSFFPVGTTTVTVTATNSCGAPSCTFTVTVNDTQAPTITCPGNITVSNDAGQCGAVVSWATGPVIDQQMPNSNAATQGATQWQSFTAGISGPLTKVELHTNGFSSGTQPYNFTIYQGQGTVGAVLYTGSGSFNTPTANWFSLNIPSGSQPVLIAGNQYTVLINITGSYNLLANSDTNAYGGGTYFSNVYNAQPNWDLKFRTYVSTGGASDNCGVPTVSYNPPSGSTFNVGTTTVTATADDGHGNTANCTFTVTVNDTQPPVIACPANITVGNTPGQCGANVTYAATVSDNCSASLSYSPASGSFFTLGTTTVTVTANDGHGNTSSCTFTVTVNDTQLPVVTCPGNTSLTVASNCQAVTPNYIAGSNVNLSVTINSGTSATTCTDGFLGGSPEPQWRVNVASQGYTTYPASGICYTNTPNVQYNQSFNCSNNYPSVLSVCFRAFEDDGGVCVVSESCLVEICQNFAVPAPGTSANYTLSIPNNGSNASWGSVNFTIAATGTFTNCPITATDNCSVSSITQSPLPGTPLGVGNHTVTITATDPTGNTGTCTFVTNVIETTPPQITCPSNITNVVATSNNGAVVNYATPVGTDNCSGATTTRIAGLASGATFPIGTTTVTHLVTDAAGLTAQCSFTVTVVATAPQIVCPSNITVNNTAGQCGTNVSFAATDSAGIPASTISYSPASGSLFPVGTTIVTATATNVVGSSSCTFTVTVNDTQAPIINSPGNIVINNTPGECSGTATFNVTATDNCSNANTVKWVLNNVTFTDGGTASGSFLYDAVTDEMSNWNISASGGNTGTFPLLTYNNTTSSGSAVTGNRLLFSSNTSTRGLRLSTTLPKTNAGGTLPLNLSGDANFNVECFNCSPFRLVNGGSLVGTPQLTITQTAGLASGSVFPIGTTTNTFVATDAAGNSSTISFTVTVNDTEDPIINSPGNIVINNTPGQCSGTATFNVTATDNCSNANTVKWVLNNVTFTDGGTASGSFLYNAVTDEMSNWNISASGGNTGTFPLLTYNNTTSSGLAVTGNRLLFSSNTSTRGLRLSTTLPKTNAGGTLPLNLSGDANFNVECFNCSPFRMVNGGSLVGTPQLTITQTAGLASGSAFPIGTTTNTFVVTDVAGNSSTTSFTVTVNDTEAPIITCPGDTTVAANNAGCTYSGSIGTATASDNCGTATISGPVPAGPYPVGTTVVTWTATDANNNVATCTQSVTVVSSLPTPSVVASGPTTFCNGGSVTLSATLPVNNTLFMNSPSAGGTPVDCKCPEGYVAVGYTGYTGSWMDKIQLACKKLNPNGTLDPAVVYTSALGIGGGGGPNGPYLLTGDKVLVGGRADNGCCGFLSLFEGYGQSISYIQANGNNSASPTSAGIFGPAGYSVGTQFVPDGNVVVGMKGWLNGYVSGISLLYAPISQITTATYSWSNGSTDSSITVAASDTYNVTVTNGFGCSASASQTVTVNPKPVAVSPSTVTICAGSSTTLQVSGATGYNWSPATGLNQTTGDTVIASPAVTTVYTITATDPGACSTTITVVVNPLPTPVINVSGPTTFCQGSSVTLAAGLSNPNVWKTGSLTFVKTVAGQTDNITPNTHLTRGNSYPLYNAITEAGAQSSCSWTPGNTEWAYGNIANWNTLSYQNLWSLIGCYPPGMVNQPMVVHLISENIYFQLTFTSWQAGGGNYTYVRTTQPAAYINHSWSNNEITPSIVVSTTGNYAVTVTDSNGCSATSATTTITVDPTTVGGTVSGGTSPICTGFAPGTLTLSGHTGSVLQWESTTDNVTWFPIANTTNTYNPGILTTTTTFRAAVQSGTCLVEYATPRTITVYQQYPFYADNDNDGYGAGPVVSLCSVNGATAPAGYSVDGTDCDDTKSDRHQTYPFYVDADGDTYGAGTAVQLCAKNAATPPLPNYSVNALDCNDLVAAIHPGVVDIRFDNIDNNCDGSLTDGGPLVVLNMVSHECGQENFKIEKELKCTKIDLNGRTHGNGLPPGMVVGYRFEITNETTGQVEYVDSNNEKVKLIETNIYNFNTWYTIRAGAIINGEFQGFNGTSCHVKTEDAGTSNVKNGQCGTTLNAMNTKINAEGLKDGKTYRFRIALAAAPGVFYYYENDKPDFKLTDVPGLPLTYQTEYLVDVQVLVKIRPEIQAWTVYGAVCSIFTPAFPETFIKTGECDYFETHATASNTIVHAESFPGATMYRFLLTGYNLITGNINYQQTLDRAVPNFTLSMFNALSPLSPNTTYNIAVSMQLYGSWVPYGKDCAITTTANPREGAIKDDTAFKAAAYPNPFANNFMIEVKTISNAIVNLKVYDMVGRLVEERSVSVPELENSPIGDRYPSGVYNVVVTQGDEVKTVRVVKR